MNTILACFMAACALGADAAQEWDARLQTAQTQYNLVLAQSLAADIRAAGDGTMTPGNRLLCAKCLLLVAELNRVQYERCPEEKTGQRRSLGGAIDDAAKEALALLAGQEEDTDVWRLRGDCYGVMIRTDYLAKKYRKQMNVAIAKALECNPENPHAQVSAARPFIFADARHGGDLEKAVGMLDKVLERHPDFEPALLLRGLAYKRGNKKEASTRDWRRAKALNPYCQTMIMDE